MGFVLTVAAAGLPRVVSFILGAAGAYSVLVTALLILAVCSGEVAVAVDPFR